MGPEIGIIDFHGLRSVPEKKVRAVLGVAEGTQLPRSKGDVEEAVEQIEGVVRAHLQAVCCEDGKAILYVGIEEQGAPHFSFHAAPEQIVLLPEEIHHAYVHFVSALNDAVRLQETDEDLTAGHSLMRNAQARAHQELFIEQAAKHLEVLRDVLRNSMNEEHRAIAAYVIGYAPDKREVIDDLLYALRDPDETVRSNAMRSLSAIEVLAKLRPTLKISIPSTWLIEMLNSVVWTDRTAAAVNLVHLTEWRDEEALNQLRTRALDSLIEMARWKHLAHALPAYILLGRMLGLEEEAIQKEWASDARLGLVEKAEELRRKKKR